MLNERNMSIEEILNYGIPYSNNISIPMSDLVTSKNEIIEHSKKIEKILKDNLGNICIFGFDAIIGMKTKYQDGKRVISYDTRTFLHCLIKNLGIKYDGDLYDYVTTCDFIKKNVRNIRNNLNKVNNFSELEKLVPNLCKDIDKQIHSMLIESPDFFKYYINNINNILCKLNFNLRYVCDCLEQPLPYETFNGANKEKLLFYIACCSFTFTKYNKDKNFHNGIYTTMKYILEKGKKYNKNLTIKNMKIIVSNSETVSSKDYSYRKLLEDYNEFLKANPNIKEEIINPKRIEGKTLREINDYLELYRLTCGRTLDTNWELLPEGKREDNGVHYYTAKIRKNNKKIDSKVEKIYREKIEFFEDSEPLFRICGKDKFEGYSGFIYKNGLVFFEKIGSDDKMAKNTALYVMNIYNFIQFSQLTKQQIIEYNKNEEGNKITRINHNNNWQQRALNILESQTNISMDEVNDVIERQFVKKR